jgi:hypothetical protein
MNFKNSAMFGCFSLGAIVPLLSKIKNTFPAFVAKKVLAISVGDWLAFPFL